MASAFTHAFIGASLLAVAPRRTRPVLLASALAIVAVIPDLDVLAFGFGIPYEAPLGHRGFTHSLTFAAMLALLAAPALARLAGVPPPFPLPPRSRHSRLTQQLWLGGLLFSAIASHGMLDAMTDAGLGIGFFIPLDETRYFLSWRPLRTSPIHPAAFFGSQGVAILANEIRYVWLPVAVVLTASWVLRRGERRDA
jgi:inner membrane protein